MRIQLLEKEHHAARCPLPNVMIFGRCLAELWSVGVLLSSTEAPQALIDSPGLSR